MGGIVGLRNYTRWTTGPGTAAKLTADILCSDTEIVASPNDGVVRVVTPDRWISPDEARMIGVRLIEAATLADGDRAVRAAR
jgi:hypothetical protein